MSDSQPIYALTSFFIDTSFPDNILIYDSVSELSKEELTKTHNINIEMFKVINSTFFHETNNAITLSQICNNMLQNYVNK